MVRPYDHFARYMDMDIYHSFGKKLKGSTKKMLKLAIILMIRKLRAIPLNCLSWQTKR